MSVTTETSRDGKFSRNENNPIGTWTCKTCFALVMTGNRPDHTNRHEAEARLITVAIASALSERTGFGT